MLADHLMVLIVADGWGVKGTDLFKGDFPPQSAEFCVAVADYGGRPGEAIFGEVSPSIEYPRAQIKVRGVNEDYDTPRTRIEKIYQALEARGAFTVNGTHYLNLSALAPPGVIGRGQNGCWVFGLNIEAMREKMQRFVTLVEKVAQDGTAVGGGL
jgi:hypothetical protein